MLTIRSGLLLALLSCWIWPAVGHSQELATCRSVAFDADGDGYGWQMDFSHATPGWHSCVVTEETTGSPEITNPQTGERVELIRPYWNANRDLAEKEIECETEFLGGFTVNHQKLPDSAPYLGLAPINGRSWTNTATYGSYYNHGPDVWTVVDGLYYGPIINIADRGTAWVELLEETEEKPAGVRFWHTHNQITVRYTECFDLSGESLRPTGYVQEVLPNEEPVQIPLLVKGVPAPEFADPLVNVETGEEVQLVEAYWDFNQQFAGKTLHCESQQYDENLGVYWHGRRGADFHIFDANTLKPEGTLSGTLAWAAKHADSGGSYDWNIKDGVLQFSDGYPYTILLHDKVEIVENRNDSHCDQIVTLSSQEACREAHATAVIRSWQSATEFVQCSVVGNMNGLFISNNQYEDFYPLDANDVEAYLPTTGNTLSDTASTGPDDNSTERPTQTSGPGTVGGASGGGGVTPCMVMLLLILVRRRAPKTSIKTIRDYARQVK